MKLDLHHLDIAALVARLAGLSILATDATFVSSVNSLFGAHGAQIIAVIGLIATFSADVLRVVGAPSGTVAQEIPAPVIAAPVASQGE